MKEPPDEKTKAEIAERLFVHWNDRQEGDEEREDVEEEDDSSDDDESEDRGPDPE